MLRFLSGLFALVLVVPCLAQTIVTEVPNRDRIVQVHTALYHLTVIEVGEPVVTVATGSDAFKVEWRGTKVFVEPREPNVSTNLFIWTASSRLNYELEPAGPVGSMDFAIDHPKPVAVLSVAKPEGKGATNKVEDPTRNFSEMNSLLEGHPVQDEQPKLVANRVNISLNSVVRQKDVLYIRYEIRNDTRGAYLPGTPKVLLLSGVRSSQSLVGREDTQLSEREATRLKVNAWSPLRVVDEELRSSELVPGEKTEGVVEVKLAPSGQAPQVLRIDFPADGRGMVTATVVL